MIWDVISTATVLALVSLATITDLRRGIIPNALTIPALLFGVTASTVLGGTQGLLLSLEGVGVALSVWILTGLLGGSLGGGDIKLLAAVGALKGPLFLLYVFGIAVMVGAVLAVAAALYRKMLIVCLRRLWQGLWTAVVLHMPHQLTTEAGTLRIPYAPAIAAGTIVTVLATIQ